MGNVPWTVLPLLIFLGMDGNAGIFFEKSFLRACPALGKWPHKFAYDKNLFILRSAPDKHGLFVGL